MKKLLSVILCLSIATALFGLAMNVSADEITVELDGQQIEFDVKPEIIEGRTMVPLRKIFEKIGAVVKWDNDTQTVSARKNSKTITLSIGSDELQIDKGKTDDQGNPIIETVTLEVPAQEVSGRTLVPARAISESFGLKVDWDEKKHKVIITSDEEEDESWKENTGSINLSDLSYKGEGVEVADGKIKITAGGDFTITGTLNNGSITISTKEKVKLRLNGAEITSAEGPCIFVEEADKAYITLTDGTENVLVAENSEDGAIYSKENLEIKGDGNLEIESNAGHGIKASDNLNIENGNIVINATSDGIHINDTFKMTGGAVNITSVGDGIDCESIVNISGGTINVETNGTPVETAPTTTEINQETQRRPMWGMDEADVEFEKSTKGINAEWMMVISGGEFNINSASHAIHCQDEMEITGGKFELSSKYDKGISAHGNLTISGSETNIDVTKSTEGIESKKVLTINDGIIKVVSTDDAINATGGKSGMMMPGGGFGGMGGGNRTPQEGGNRAPQQGENRTPQGGEFKAPEGGFGRGQRAPVEGNAPAEGEKQPGETTRPQRGGNGQFGGMRPRGEAPANGEFKPSAEMPPNGKFTPPANGEFKPPFENGANGEFKPPFEMPGNGEFTPPAGERPQMNGGGFGGMGGMGRNMKECLIINGGYLELCGNDDCVDANGNMTINGGTIMAANPKGAFTGNFGVLDADGQIKISENANVILAASSGRNINVSQNSIIVYCEENHVSGDKITLSDSKGNVVYEFAPQGDFKTVLIASGDIKIGEKYTVSIGTETFETEIAEQSTVIGTQASGGMGFFGRGQKMQ